MDRFRLDFWKLRAQAKKAYPGSYANRRKWFKLKVDGTGPVKVGISTKYNRQHGGCGGANCYLSHGHAEAGGEVAKRQ